MTESWRRNRFVAVVLTGAFALAAFVSLPGAALAEEKKDEKAPTAEQIEFFEKKIRPVLVDKCYSCHSHQAKKLKGEYYADSRDAIRKGGESGEKAIVLGEPDKSPLIKMIRRTDPDSVMPPKDKDALTKEQVKDFEEWVKQGAPDPRKEPDKSKPKGGGDEKSARAADAPDHWAFKKPVEPVVPQVANAGWVRSPLDAFVIAKLEARNMKPAPQADKHTLIRRAYFTLVGLPPTPEEVAAFEADQSADAFAKVVDRLLASPHYGERWGRYWLDVARYADTKGYVFEEERKFPYAYTYRDYVIRAFNEDLPYDRFLIEQIAADRLDLGDDKRPLAAMGFLTVGRRFLQNQYDIIDDRIDVVTRGTMALTVQCARCHDHKYDPIPIDDYYSLYGIFASSVEPQTLPVIAKPETTSASLAFEKELQAREAAVEAYLAQQSGEALKRLRSAKAVSDYLIATTNLGSSAETTEINKRLANRWAEFLSPSKNGHDPIFTPWHAYVAIPEGEFAAKSPAVTEELFGKTDAAKPIHPLVAEAFRGKPAPASMREVADRYGALLAAQSQDQPHGDPERESIRMVLHGLASPLYATGDQRMRFLKVDERRHFTSLRRKVEELRANDPGAPAAAMVLNDSPNPSDARVLKRGSPGMPGDVVPRRMLACVSPEPAQRKPFTDGSGRLELARAIASADNPLTARVMVNRIWLNHFGAGLVRTPSDFGVRCEPPVHPEMLDWLALRFVEGKWSVKNVHRIILNSATWQQASDGADSAYANADPENTLLWRNNRRRMDFEAMRDTLLAVGDVLDETVGGRAVDIIDPANSRRSIYGFIDRQNLPGMFRTFDFASPDTHSPNRFFTTVPQQALFMLNSPFVERVSRKVAARDDVAEQAGAAKRIDRLYRALFGRAPSPDELAAGKAFVGSDPADNPTVIAATPWRYGYGRYDASSDRVVEFKPLSRFEAPAWRAATEAVASDAKLTWVMLTDGGGHPGGDAGHAVVRRWIAPADGTLNIGGTVQQKHEQSDGVFARIVSSRAGQLSSWTVRGIEAATNLSGVAVRKGDTIDFVVEPRQTEHHDAFAWSPTLKLTTADAAVAGGTGIIESDARREFAGPLPAAMGAWEKYAQVLLLSNEFAFVD